MKADEFFGLWLMSLLVRTVSWTEFKTTYISGATKKFWEFDPEKKT